MTESQVMGSGKAPDDGAETHDAVEDGNAVAQAAVVVRCISTENDTAAG